VSYRRDDQPAEPSVSEQRREQRATESEARVLAPDADLFQLASAVGNRAFGAAIARQVAAPITAGPLANLRDELDDDEVDEDDCLEYIGQLGPGEKVIVARDATLMRQMAEAFNAGEMAQAVEVLDLPLRDAIHHMRQADDLDDAPRDTLVRILGGATPDEFVTLVGDDAERAAVEGISSIDPLTLGPVRADPARAIALLATAAFAKWCRSRSGGQRLAAFIARHDAAGGMAALKQADEWGVLLNLLGFFSDELDRETLATLFAAATEQEDRRRLYEVRFGRGLEQSIDWAADGEAEWDAAEQRAGQRSQADIDAAISSGLAPATAAEAEAAVPGGPLQKLREELDDVEVDEAACLGYMAQLTDVERHLLRTDATLRRLMAEAFDDPTEAARVVEMLRFPELKGALSFLVDSGQSAKVDGSLYLRLIDRADAGQVLDALLDAKSLQALQFRPDVDPLSFDALNANDVDAARVVQSAPIFSSWAIHFAAAGGQAYLRWIVARNPQLTAPALEAAGRVDMLLDSLPSGGTALPPEDQAAMRELFLRFTDLGDKRAWMCKRFDLDEVRTEDWWGTPDFDAPGLDRIWQVLEQLPPAHVADNAWLEDITRLSGSSSGTPHGVTGSDWTNERVGVGYDAANIGALETGAFTDPGDQMRGTNMFDNNLIHEIGHAVDNEYGFTDDGGPFDTLRELGQWKEYSGSRLVDELSGATNLASAVTDAGDLRKAKRALALVADHEYADPEDGFKLAAVLDGGAWGYYGASSDRYKPLWTLLSGHQIVTILSAGHEDRAAWMNPGPAVGAPPRFYHHDGYGSWVSYLASARSSGKLSRYQFRGKGEYFAEAYSTYYLTAPADPGRLLRSYDPKVYEWYRVNVDRGFGTPRPP
jgi:hypothetical protein